MDKIRWWCYGCRHVRPSDTLGGDGLPVTVDCLFELTPYKTGKCPRRDNSIAYQDEIAEEKFYDEERRKRCHI